METEALPSHHAIRCRVEAQQEAGARTAHQPVAEPERVELRLIEDGDENVPTRGELIDEVGACEPRIAPAATTASSTRTSVGSDREIPRSAINAIKAYDARPPRYVAAMTSRAVERPLRARPTIATTGPTSSRSTAIGPMVVLPPSPRKMRSPLDFGSDSSATPVGIAPTKPDTGSPTIGDRDRGTPICTSSPSLTETPRPGTVVVATRNADRRGHRHVVDGQHQTTPAERGEGSGNEAGHVDSCRDVHRRAGPPLMTSIRSAVNPPPSTSRSSRTEHVQPVDKHQAGNAVDARTPQPRNEAAQVFDVASSHDPAVGRRAC